MTEHLRKLDEDDSAWILAQAPLILRPTREHAEAKRRPWGSDPHNQWPPPGPKPVDTSKFNQKAWEQHKRDLAALYSRLGYELDDDSNSSGDSSKADHSNK